MKSLIFATFTLTSSIFLTSTAFAATCNRADVDHYLQQGFTPDQVVQLCSSKAPSAPAAAVSASADEVPATITAKPNRLSEDEWFTLKNAIDADKVFLQGETLIYVRDRCHKFGEEDVAGFQSEACVNTKTQVSLKGLRIINAQKGMFLIQDPELLVSGKISREILNPESLHKRLRTSFTEAFKTQPKELDIPVRKGFEPPKIATILKKLAH